MVHTWRFLWALMRYRGWIFTGTAALSLVAFLVPISQGLITKSIFDTLTHHATVGIGMWELLAVMVGIAGSSIGLWFVRLLGFTAIEFNSIALLRSGCLYAILSSW